ncbi:MAG: hypothetical protein V4489_08665 [Chlamydiota bacterium]
MSTIVDSLRSSRLPPDQVLSNRELIHQYAAYLELAEIGGLCRVSKVWNESIRGSDGRLFWKSISIREGIPVVQGEYRDHQDDFRFLLPITISGRIIGKYLGKVDGEVPLMSKVHFLKLKSLQDDFEPTKCRRDTHVVIVDPSKLKITVSKDRPLRLDASGTLEEVPSLERALIEKAELTVPFSFKNLKMLTTYPLSRKGNGPVFDKGSGPAVFEQCYTPPDQNRILIMRREVVGTNRLFNSERDQNALVTNRGWKVVTVRQRGFYDAIEILKTGTCSDGQAPWTYARSAERDCKVAIGGFASSVGVLVSHNYGFAHDFVGVVPGVFAEVP